MTFNRLTAWTMGAIRHSARLAGMILVLHLPVLQGCSDLLTESPKDILTIENFYQTDADARAAVAATYRPLSDLGLFGTAMKSALIMAADDARVGPLEVNASIIAVSTLAFNPAIPRVSFQPWDAWYDIITKSNLIIETFPGKSTMSEAVRSQVVGEAKFLRALSYFYLVRLWGDVPLVTTAADQVGKPSRTPAADVFAQIIRDATEAEAALPASWGASDKGRAPKGAAQTLLSDVYLWRSSAMQKNEWQQATDAAQRVIASGVYKLEPNYLNAFNPGSQNRGEEIFAAQGTASTNGPEIRTADMFYPQEMGANGTGGFAAVVPLPWSVDSSYAVGDYRKDVTYFTSGKTITGQTVTFAPHVFKYRPTAHPGPQDTNWPIYRYAEVLLFNAEALNELGRTTEAVTFLNQVRARARNGTGTENRAQPANYSGALTQSAVRDAIIEERRIETVFEGDRWFDLIRRGPAYFLNAMKRDPHATDVSATDMLWPIPQRAIDANSNLTQNPGY
ncbi:MAG: RagB/SusD family nutrient uptake outer membrane protein [Gemmatimonadaceae bacterium]